MSAKFNNVPRDLNTTAKRIGTMKKIAVAMGILILILIIAILLLRSCQAGEPPHGSVDIPGNVIAPLPIAPHPTQIWSSVLMAATPPTRLTYRECPAAAASTRFTA